MEFSDYLNINLDVRSRLKENLIFGYYVDEIKRCLRDHSSHNLVTRSGHNRVHRIGIIEDIKMVLRVPWGFEFTIDPEVMTRKEVETYAQNASLKLDSMEPGPGFCLPVSYLKRDSAGGLETWFALLCSDLTEWGRYELRDHRVGLNLFDPCRKDRHTLSGEYFDTVHVDLGPRNFGGEVTDYFFTLDQNHLNLQKEIVVE